LGQLWGFLKYHHPAVAKGNYNWDAELFRVMPATLKANNVKELSTVLEKWVDALGAPQICTNCFINEKPENIKLRTNYGLLFNNKVLSISLIKKLTYILNNRNTGKGYYIDMAQNGNPQFDHEKAYASMQYPDVGYRLLCLYRYWSMINYYFPYKHLIGEDWNGVLADCIPKFIASTTYTDYILNTLALIARVHDTHANIWNTPKALSVYKGKDGVPFQAKFIEDKLVVTGYYNDINNIKELVKQGDVIEKIDGISVAELIKKYLPYTPASNYATQLRDLPKAFLLRTNQSAFKFGILRNGKQQSVSVQTVPLGKINFAIDYSPDSQAPGFYLLDNNIGYLFPGRYYSKDLPAIKQLFNNTKGIIIDMRCYPSEFMPFSFGPYIKTNYTAFVKFSKGSLLQPGLFILSEPISVMPESGGYKGKVVVIVNEESQSQAEYTTMAFQSSPNVKVIGSTTAGADGDVSHIILPGGISTIISGLGIYYPDGTETQRKGIKIDLVVKPTVQGIKAGKDELLDKAKEEVLK